jgi:hypothetical protein
MKQPIAGIAGTKPRPPKVAGNGNFSRAEARELDLEYRRQRNEQLRLKNEHTQALLLEAHGKLISRHAVERGLGFVFIALRSKILMIHQTWSFRLANSDLPKVQATLAELEISLLNELASLKDADPDEFLAKGTEEETEPSPSDLHGGGEKMPKRERRRKK